MQLKRTTAFRRSMPLAALAGLMAFSGPLSLAPVVAYADNANTQQLNSQLDAAKAKLDELSSRLEIAAATVEDTEFQLGETTAQIESLKTEIAEKKEKVASIQSDLATTATESYKSGSISLVDILLSSQSFSELSSRLFYANKIADTNSAKIEEVNGLLSSLSEQQDTLAKKEKELTGLLETQKASKAELEAARADAQSYVDGLSSELQAALQAEREAEAARQKAELEAQLQQQAQQQQQQQQQQPQQPQPQKPSQPNKPQQPSKPQGGSGNLSSSARSTIVAAAQSQLGVPYDLGACIPGVAMDCSGLTSYAYAQAGISIPHSSRAQYSRVSAAGNLKGSASALTAGDLVFYQRGGIIYHVAIYVGGGNVCHANGYGQGVVITGVFYDSGFCGGGSPI